MKAVTIRECAFKALEKLGKREGSVVLMAIMKEAFDGEHVELEDLDSFISDAQQVAYLALAPDIIDSLDDEDSYLGSIGVHIVHEEPDEFNEYERYVGSRDYYTPDEDEES